MGARVASKLWVSGSVLPTGTRYDIWRYDIWRYEGWQTRRCV